MRYALLNLLYRLRFPSGFITATDFRPHFDGHLINTCTMIPSHLDPASVEDALIRRLRQSFMWVRLFRFLLRPGDRVQYCLGTREPRQQYMKAWSSHDDLSAGIPPRDVTEYWR
jgi:hypothetical protein